MNSYACDDLSTSRFGTEKTSKGGKGVRRHCHKGNGQAEIQEQFSHFLMNRYKLQKSGGDVFEPSINYDFSPVNELIGLRLNQCFTYSKTVN